MKNSPLPPRKAPLKRTPLPRGSSLTRSGGLQAVSRNQRTRLWQYSSKRTEWIAQFSTCQFPLGCANAPTEVHHKRGRVGSDLLDELHWIALCHDHHQWVTEHPRAAYALGVSERRVS